MLVQGTHGIFLDAMPTMFVQNSVKKEYSFLLDEEPKASLAVYLSDRRLITSLLCLVLQIAICAAALVLLEKFSGSTYLAPRKVKPSSRSFSEGDGPISTAIARDSVWKQVQKEEDSVLKGRSDDVLRAVKLTKVYHANGKTLRNPAFNLAWRAVAFLRQALWRINLFLCRFRLKKRTVNPTASPDMPVLAAVKGVTFGVQKGECLTLLGPNGAGRPSFLST